MRRCLLLVLCVVALLAGSTPASAQPTTGTVAGTIADGTGGVLPGVTVTITGAALAEPRTVVTDARGAYRIDTLAPGTYDVAYTMPGYVTARRKGLRVTAGATLKEDVALTVSQAEEVIVTAQKRGENLQDVPISITALTEQRLEASRVIGLSDVAALTPNFSFLETDDSKYSVPKIRGVFGNVLSAGGIDQPTGVYVDEVYMSTSVAQQSDFFDVERIEVLRGPQGTLFGRNTIAGAISITTKKPSETFEGYLEGGYGNYNAIRVKGGVSGPLVPGTLFGRFSALYNDREGYETNRFTGNDVNNRHNWGVRGALRLVASPRVEFNLVTDYRDVDQGGRAMDIAGFNQDPATAPLGPGPGLLYLIGIAKPEANGLDRIVAVDFEGVETLHAGGGVLSADVKFGGATLKSITAFRKHEFFQSYDLDSSEAPINRQGGPERVTGFSQEVRLSSAPGRRLDWILGGFYYRQDSHNEFNIELTKDNPSARALIGTISPALLGLPFGPTHTDGKVTLDSYAGFGHATWHATPKLDVTVGLRGTHEKKTVEYFQTSPLGNQIFGLAAIPFRENSGTWGAFTPMSIVEYQWTPAAMTYASVATGFKSGGFSDIVGSLPDQSFKEEHTINYEAGFKTEFFDRALVFNGAAFVFNWDDQQGTLRKKRSGLETVDLLIEATVGDIRTKGIELEASAYPIRGKGLELSASVGVLRSEYLTVSPEAMDVGVAVGDKVQDVPDWTLGLAARYSTPLGAAGNLSLGTDYQYRSSLVIAGSSVGGTDTQEGYGLLNGNIAFDPAGGHWGITVWGKNLADETYVTFQTSDSLSSFVFQALRQRLGPPRSVGVDLRYRF